MLKHALAPNRVPTSLNLVPHPPVSGGVVFAACFLGFRLGVSPAGGDVWLLSGYRVLRGVVFTRGLERAQSSFGGEVDIGGDWLRVDEEGRRGGNICDRNAALTDCRATSLIACRHWSSDGATDMAPMDHGRRVGNDDTCE